MRDIVVVMPTVDRRTKGRPNYLIDTVLNAKRAGVFDSDRLSAFLIVDSGGSSAWPPVKQVNEIVGYDVNHRPPLAFIRAIEGVVYAPSLNVVRALRTGASIDADAKWVLYLEDDIDFCAKFLESVGSWLDEHDNPNIPVYALGANYKQIEVAYIRGMTSWQYPIDAYYGTQAFAMRREDAKSLADWLGQNPSGRDRALGAYDISMHDWAHEERPQSPFFLASVPSMVQHLGRESHIRDGGDWFGFESWPGREWSYPEDHTKNAGESTSMSDHQGRVAW